MEAPGIEPRDTYVPIVVKRREDDADCTTQDDPRRREVSASTPMSPDEAIRVAAKRAIDAGNFASARSLLDLLEVEWRAPFIVGPSALAALYGVETRVLTQAVKRNRARFLATSCFS